MSNLRVQLTPEVQDFICEHIRNGADPFTAAEAAGVPLPVFESWLRFGQARRPVRMYREFYQALRTAAARAICEAQRRKMIAAYNRDLLSVPADQRENNPILSLMEKRIRGEPAFNCVEPAANINETTTEDRQTAANGEQTSSAGQ
jgi:hypothetical protein